MTAKLVRASAPARLLFPVMPVGTVTVTLPVTWFLMMFRAALNKLVKPVTAETRRVQKVLKMSMPMEVVMELLEPFSTGEIPGLEWETLACGRRLVPTKTTATNHHYKYELTKGQLQDKLWRLQESDLQKKPGQMMWKRGSGAAKLHLSQAAAMRGELTQLLVLVCGKTVLEVVQPRDWKRMPLVTARVKTLSMDNRGNIILPCEFDDPAYKASLRKQARILLQTMIDDPGYPTGPQPLSWHAALTGGGQTIIHNSNALLLPPPPLPPADSD